MRQTARILIPGIFLLLAACGAMTQAQPTVVCGTPLPPETQSGVLSDEQVFLEFVGEYYAGFMEVASYTLAIHCDHSFESKTGYDFTVEHAWGLVVVREGLLELQGTGWTAKFVPVRWGPRHYLVSAETVSDFCAAVRSGAEPRKDTVRVDYLRGVDRNLSVTGDPILPSGEKVCP